MIEIFACYIRCKLHVGPYTHGLSKLADKVCFFVVIPWRDMSTQALNRIHIYMVVNLKRELEFKMVVTVVLQDIHNMYITRKNPYVYILFYIYILLCLSFKN